MCSVWNTEIPTGENNPHSLPTNPKEVFKDEEEKEEMGKAPLNHNTGEKRSRLPDQNRRRNPPISQEKITQGGKG